MPARFIQFVLLGIFIIWFSAYLSAPYLVKTVLYSPVLYSKEGRLIAAVLSKDGQWRFPVSDTISEKYITCLSTFEDKRFFYHLGFDPVAFSRALYYNFINQKISSGGSTISMQLARLLLGNPRRSIGNKIKETWYAIGLEFNYNKTEILKLYGSVAPYGGNVVGIQTAAWRYFHCNANQLSWAESALLAVLPNQPSSVHLAKNRKVLLQKRNDLLDKLKIQKRITEETFDLAVLEPIPEKLFTIPVSGSMLLEYLRKKYPEDYSFYSTISADIQDKFIEISKHHARNLLENEIHNLSVILVDNKTSELVSYLGNNPDSSNRVKNSKVNNIHKPRSSGSILKPLLYAAALDRGLICPKTLLADIPTLISGFRPENYSRNYGGAIPADQCIQRSLNVPAVRLLQLYGVEFFYNQLKQCGFNNLFRTSEEYGLSLILGGAEVTAWDLARVYSGFARQILESGKLNKFIPEISINRLKDYSDEKNQRQIQAVYSNAALFEMIQCMKGSVLPHELSTHFFTENQKKIAWKTGTSFGYKDAWCVGITPEYTLVVWIGNSSGMGRPGLIGVHTAAPLLFELYYSLDISDVWDIPYDDMYQTRICRQSGYLPSPNCKEVDTIWSASTLNELTVCKFHQQIFLDSSSKWRVFKDCFSQYVTKNWFGLPPVMEYFYKSNHPDYKLMPPLHPDCIHESYSSEQFIEFIYPDKGIEVFIPVDLDDRSNDIILKAVHKDAQAVIYWFLDNNYLGTTSQGLHEWKINPGPGIHSVKISDEKGHAATAVIKCFNQD